jgi:subtilisin family serine protease
MNLASIRSNSFDNCDIVVRLAKPEYSTSMIWSPQQSPAAVAPIPSLELTYTASVSKPVWLDRQTVAVTLRRQDLDEFVLRNGVVEIFENAVFVVPHPPEIGAAAAVENEANWGLEFLRIADLVREGCTGAGVRVGVLDSGVSPTHPCFNKGQLKGYAAFSGAGQLIAAEGPRDSMWHGTHVCGILGGADDGFPRGVSPLSELYVGRVLDGWNGSVASIKAGLIWMRDVVKPQVLNLSLGWPGMHPEWYSELTDIVAAGTIVCVASGNEYTSADKHRSPANYALNRLLSIGAIDQQGDVWEYSGGGTADWLGDGNIRPGRAELPTLVAPGVNIVSSASTSTGGNTYRRESGTSMATPFVSGILALLISHPKILAVDDALRILLDSRIDRGRPGVDDRFGGGVLDPASVIENVRNL